MRADGWNRSRLRLWLRDLLLFAYLYESGSDTKDLQEEKMTPQPTLTYRPVLRFVA